MMCHHLGLSDAQRRGPEWAKGGGVGLKQNCDKNEKNIADPRMISGLLATQNGP